MSNMNPQMPGRPGFDPQWVLGAAKGDPNAQANLYRATYGGVYQTVRSMIQDEQICQNLIQEIYGQAFASLNTLGDPSKFDIWINAMARNKAGAYLNSIYGVSQMPQGQGTQGIGNNQMMPQRSGMDAINGSVPTGKAASGAIVGKVIAGVLAGIVVLGGAVFGGIKLVEHFRNDPKPAVEADLDDKEEKEDPKEGESKDTDKAVDNKGTVWVLDTAESVYSDDKGEDMHMTYRYDILGNVISVDDGYGQSTYSYEYDIHGNPVKIIMDDAWGVIVVEHVYEYDAEGRIHTNLEKGYDIETLYTYEYVVDENGNVVTRSVHRDVGDLSMTQTYTMLYNAEGKLIQMTMKAEGDLEGMQSEGESWTYEYDGNGNLIKETYINGWYGATEIKQYHYIEMPLSEYEAERQKAIETPLEPVNETSGSFVDPDKTKFADAYAETIEYYRQFFSGEVRGVDLPEVFTETMVNWGTYTGAFYQDENGYVEYNSMYGDDTDIVYALWDINFDGIEELMVGELSFGDSYLIHDFWTLVDGKPKFIVYGDARFNYIPTYDGYLSFYGSSGAASYSQGMYSLNPDGTLEREIWIEYDLGEVVSSGTSEMFAALDESEYEERIHLFEMDLNELVWLSVK